MKAPVALEEQVARTATLAGRARYVLAQLVRKGVVRIGDDCFWGQFLDDPRDHNQKGIYGTSAAVELLAANGDSVTAAPVSSALSGLPLSGTGQAYEQEDTRLVFKVAAIVEACAQSNASLDLNHPAVVCLIQMQLDERGWCGYRADPDRAAATAPEVVPTAVALIALAHVKAWHAEPAAESSVLWLSDRLRTDSTDEVGAALGLLALNSYRRIGGDNPVWQAGRHAAEVRVEELITRDESALEVTPSHYIIDLTKPDGKYMYFAPALVGALALLSGERTRPVGAGPKVVNLVKTVAARTVRDGGFRYNNRVATVDQLWVDRLLRAFIERATKPTHLMSPVASLLLARRRRWIVIPMLLAVAWVGVLLAAGENISSGQVVGALASGLALNVLATVIFVRRTD